jgi:hypothetical protein
LPWPPSRSTARSAKAALVAASTKFLEWRHPCRYFLPGLKYAPLKRRDCLTLLWNWVLVPLENRPRPSSISHLKSLASTLTSASSLESFLPRRSTIQKVLQSFPTTDDSHRRPRLFYSPKPLSIELLPSSSSCDDATQA